MTHPTLNEINGLIVEFNETFDVDTIDQALVLSEESGEVSEAVLRLQGKKLFKPHGSREAVTREVADLIFTARSVAISTGVAPVEIDTMLHEIAQNNLERDDDNGPDT